MTPVPTSSGLGKGTVLALAAMGLGVFVIANDFTAFSVALPKMESDLGTDLHDGPVGHRRGTRSCSACSSSPVDGSPTCSAARKNSS